MKSGKIGTIVISAAAVLGLGSLAICTEKIPVGYEGVVYSMNNGIQDETLKQGWHLVSPTKKIKLFTTSNEQLLLTRDSRKGSSDDEAFNVSTADDASIAVSFQMSYRYIPEQIPSTFSNFRGMSGEEIVDNRVKTVLRAKVSEVTTNYTMMDIYSGNRAAINAQLTESLNAAFKDAYGIQVVDASIIDVHPDEKLQKAIDDRVTAIQNKQKAQAEQEAARVEAETKNIKAEGDAEAMLVGARAEAEAYRIKSEQITDNLLRKWELDARMAHGWVTIQGANTVVTPTK